VSTVQKEGGRLSSVGLPDVMSVIIKRGCFKDEDLLLSGVTNHCNTLGIFHTFIDCDDIGSLSDILAVLEEKKYRDMGDWLILNTSPWNFSLANFARLSWNDYIVLLQNFPLVHDGYLHYTAEKGYAALRLGAKYGIAPTITYRLSSIPVGVKYCKTCYNQFFHLSEYLQQL
jgi:hypothetical protein